MILSILLKLTQALGVSRFLIAGGLFIPLERIAPHRGRKPIFRDGWRTDLASFVFNGLIFFILYYGWRHYLAPNGIGWLKPLPAPWNLHGQHVVVQGLAVMGIGSLVYYWGHRALHTFTPLWRFHAVHHSIEEMDWLATYRGHVFETFFFTSLTTIPIVLFGVSQPAGTAFLVYRFLESQIEHSNVRLPLGFLKWVLPSPWYHHWHHAREAEAQNKNFSPYPVWDVLFRTAYMPAGRLPQSFGTDEPVPKDYPGQLVYPLMWDRSPRVSTDVRRVAPPEATIGEDLAAGTEGEAISAAGRAG